MVEVGDSDSFHQPFIHQLCHGLKTEKALLAADSARMDKTPKHLSHRSYPYYPVPASQTFEKSKRHQEKSKAGFNEPGRAKPVTEEQNAVKKMAEQNSCTLSTHKDNRKPAREKNAKSGTALPPTCPQNQYQRESRCLSHPLETILSRAVIRRKNRHSVTALIELCRFLMEKINK